MTERLTDKINHEAINRCGEYSSCYSCKREICYITELCNKLGMLEDVMEKYNVKTVEELDNKLANFDNFMKVNKFETIVIEDLQNALNGKFIEVFDEKNKIWQDMVKNLTKTEKDRDTWQKACELACKTLEVPNGFCAERRCSDKMCYECLMETFYKRTSERN